MSLRTVCSRTRAYVALWALLFAIILLRGQPTVPTVVEHAPKKPFTIDLNNDPWERLTLISGIGETTARRIVTARTHRGRFNTLEEVMQLPGVPDRPLREARQWLVLGR